MPSNKLSAEPAVNPPVPVVEPAWELNASCWIFPHWTSSATMAANRDVRSFSPSSLNGKVEALAGLDPGSYHPLEKLPPQLAQARDVFRGGMGGWILYRYSSSPAGPYDELIYVAGSFTSSTTDAPTSLRITNIYVSTDDSVFNGRRNWNIPKHRARFVWSHASDSTSAQTVSILHPDDSPLDSSRPFFSAKLSTSSWLPRIPVETDLPFLPSIALVQPDLLESDSYEASSAPRKAQIGTTPEGMYRSTAPTFRGRFGLAYSEPDLEVEDGSKAYGDGVGFPQSKRTFGYGVHFKHVVVRFPFSKEYPFAKKAL